MCSRIVSCRNTEKGYDTKRKPDKPVKKQEAIEYGLEMRNGDGGTAPPMVVAVAGTRQRGHVTLPRQTGFSDSARHLSTS